MASNHRLTGVLRGRVIVGTQNQNDTLTVRFDDGSTLTVRTAGSSHAASTGGRVEAVREQGDALSLDLDNGTTLAVRMAEPGASVTVRGADHGLQYAG